MRADVITIDDDCVRLETLGLESGFEAGFCTLEVESFAFAEQIANAGDELSVRPDQEDATLAPAFARAQRDSL